jgi:hypothetical protein
MRKCVLIAALTIASIGGCPAPVSNDPARLEVNDTLREACYGHNDAQIRRWIAEVLSMLAGHHRSGLRRLGRAVVSALTTKIRP